MLSGQYDKIVTVDKLAALSALLRRSRRVVLPSCGHLSHEETPAQLLEVLVPFCRHRLEQH
jgi:pimeloyl-ACP methyl ester carboxylesterase